MSQVKPISLALQGGGALGAYSWGALDRLLEDNRIEIAAISGSSAGAMCAVALADGFQQGGREGARAKLRAFWTGVARAGRANPYRNTPLAAFLSAFAGASPFAGPTWPRASPRPTTSIRSTSIR